MYESPSGKKYIGQTINEISRKCRFRDLTKCYAGGGKLENARKKYGPENFKYTILEEIYNETKELVIEDLNKLEIDYIKLYDTYKTGYNSTEGGQNVYSDKMSEVKRGKKHSEETKRKISENVKKTKNSKGYYQKPIDQETKQKIKKARQVSVLQYDLEGNFIKE